MNARAKIESVRRLSVKKSIRQPKSFVLYKGGHRWNISLFHVHNAIRFRRKEYDKLTVCFLLIYVESHFSIHLCRSMSLHYWLNQRTQKSQDLWINTLSLTHECQLQEYYNIFCSGTYIHVYIWSQSANAKSDYIPRPTKPNIHL